jgi:hypothetical protein
MPQLRGNEPILGLNHTFSRDHSGDYITQVQNIPEDIV